MKRGSNEIVQNAWKAKVVVPAFNIPYFPMMEPVIRALRDTRSFGLVAVARVEWEKFQARSPRAVYDLYQELKDERFTRLHMDHVPAIEDGRAVDYERILSEAIALGYESIMVDGSYLPLDQNIAATRKVVEMGRQAGIAVEGEIGMVMGYDPKDLPPYEELYRTGKGFTDPQEALRFVQETRVDWISVAVGNVHGALTAARRQKKLQATIHIERLDNINRLVNRPIVLHGGTGIRKEALQEAIRHGVAKINIATAIRQPYEAAMGESVELAQERVYEASVRLIREELEIEDSAGVVNPQD